MHVRECLESYAATPFWKEKVNGYVALAAAYKMHSQELAEVSTTLKRAGKGEASLTEISAAAKSMGFLQEEIKEGVSSFANRIKLEVGVLVDKLLTAFENGGYKEEKQSLQEIVMEASLAWPLEEFRGGNSEDGCTPLSRIRAEQSHGTCVLLGAARRGHLRPLMKRP